MKAISGLPRGRARRMNLRPRKLSKRSAARRSCVLLPARNSNIAIPAYVVLGQIIERVTGERYAEFLKEAIFDPLGMHDTLVVDERMQKAPRLALAYARRNRRWEDITYTPENHIYGEDGIVSTLDDLYKWDQALYTERLVSRAMLEMAFTPGRTNDGKEIRTGIGDRPNSYGFGWFHQLGRWRQGCGAFREAGRDIPAIFCVCPAGG